IWCLNAEWCREKAEAEPVVGNILKGRADDALPPFYAGRPHPRRADQAPRHRYRSHRHKGAAAPDPLLVEERGQYLYVTSGIGTSGLPVRWGVPPEIVVLDTAGKQRT